MAIGGDYYNPNDKIVYDGNTAEAADLNAINTAVDTAFETVSADIVTVDNKITGVSDDAEKWATDPQGTNPDPLQPTEYSSFANAQEAKAWASGTGGVDTEADGTTVIPYSANEKATAAANSASAADTSATNAATSESNAATSESNAATSASNAATSETNAGTSETNAAASETKASEWADKAEDSPVETGPDRYSAFHWAQKAAAEVVDAVQQTSDTGSAVMPKGTTAQRDGTPLSGYLRFNTEDTTFEGYDGTEWGPIGGGGLDWTTAVTNSSFTAESGNGYKIDTRVAEVTVTLPATPTEGMRVAIKDDYGTFNTFNCIIDRNGSEIGGSATNYILDQEDQYIELTYGTSNGWVITAIGPMNYVRNKPFMHVQDRKPIGTAGGASVAGSQTRDLNYVVYNDIAGASLSANQVTLPAGTYYIEACAPAYQTRSHVASITDGSSTRLLEGTSPVAGASDGSSTYSYVHGQITLASSTTIELTHFTRNAVATQGLGINTVDYDINVYSEMRIWRLDQDIQTIIYDDQTMTAMPMEMIVQRTEAPGGADGVTLALGDNQLELNSILVNDIPGASRTGNDINLPAGYYEIEGIVECFETNVTQVYIKNDAGTVIGVGHANRAAGSSDCMQAYIKTRITLLSADTIEFWIYSSSGGLNGRTGTGGEDLVWNTFTIRQLDSVISTPVVDDSTLVAARPLFQAQHQEPSGTPGGDAVLGLQDRTLNTVITNEISGASLSSNQITLPAGEYYVTCDAPTIRTAKTQTSITKADNTVLLEGLILNNGSASDNSSTVPCEGKIVLTETTAIKVRTEAGAAQVQGLGEASGFGVERYVDIQIYKLDELRQTPIISGNSLYPLPGNSFVTGDMFGLDYAKTGANQVTVEAGICMDSLNTTDLDLPSSQAVSVGTTINQVYNLFLCDDQTVRTDTDVNGSSLSAYKIRWIGFVRNNSSGNICEFYQNGDHIAFAKASENIVSAAIAVTPATVDHSSFLPVSRIESIEYGTTGATASMTATLDGTDTAYQVGIATAATDTSKDSWGDANEQKASLKPFNSSMQFRVNTGTQDLLVHSVIVKR